MQTFLDTSIASGVVSNETFSNIEKKNALAVLM